MGNYTVHLNCTQYEFRPHKIVIKMMEEFGLVLFVLVFVVVLLWVLFDFCLFVCCFVICLRLSGAKLIHFELPHLLSHLGTAPSSLLPPNSVTLRDLATLTCFPTVW